MSWSSVVKIEPVVVIGGGPAGIAAAIELSRSGFDPVLFEKNRLGGLVRNANLVENYPGFPGGISGVDLVGKLEEHVTRGGIRVINERVNALSLNNETFNVSTADGEYLFKSAIVATGTRPKTIDNLLPNGNESDRIHHDVCSISDISGKKVVVVGAGDAAFDYAIGLAAKNEVTILNRNSRYKCVQRLWDRVQQISSIKYLDNISLRLPARVSDDAVVIGFLKNDEELEVRADVLLIAVGREANLEFVSQDILAFLKEQQDRGPFHIIGDAINGDCRMAGISIGQGIHAAMKVSAFLKGNVE